MLVTCQRFGDLFLFGLGWAGSTLQFRQNILKVDSKSWLLTCSSNITLSLPSIFIRWAGSALKRELNFCNGYLSLLYFCPSFYELASPYGLWWSLETCNEWKGCPTCLSSSQPSQPCHSWLKYFLQQHSYNVASVQLQEIFYQFTYYCNKVHIFWEGQKIWKNIPVLFDFT